MRIRSWCLGLDMGDCNGVRWRGREEMSGGPKVPRMRMAWYDHFASNELYYIFAKRKGGLALIIAWTVMTHQDGYLTGYSYLQALGNGAVMGRIGRIYLREAT